MLFIDSRIRVSPHPCRRAKRLPDTRVARCGPLRPDAKGPVSAGARIDRFILQMEKLSDWYAP